MKFKNDKAKRLNSFWGGLIKVLLQKNNLEVFMLKIAMNYAIFIEPIQKGQNFSAAVNIHTSFCQNLDVYKILKVCKFFNNDEYTKNNKSSKKTCYLYVTIINSERKTNFMVILKQKI